MLISLLDRLFVIAVIVLCAAGLMVTFGVSSTAVAHDAVRREVAQEAHTRQHTLIGVCPSRAWLRSR